jgi:hypothetical protein
MIRLCCEFFIFILALIIAAVIVHHGLQLNNSVGKTVATLGIVAFVLLVAFAFEVVRMRHNDF